jgi:GNAT superfamily N-acetyltransferase
MKIERLTFEQIFDVWNNELWPDRQSPIETHSAMTWPFEGNPQPIDMNIFTYTPTFWGMFIDNKLIGVNSGHKTSDTQYRSRGIWVDPEYRGKGLAQYLFTITEHRAILEKCNMIWSIPRKTALSSYTNYGFDTVGDFIKTETSEANIYVKKII